MTRLLTIEPEYVSKKTLAVLLDMGERTIDDYVKRRILPSPVNIGNCVRWHWPSVKDTLANITGTDLNEPDAFDRGVERVAAEEASGCTA